MSPHGDRREGRRPLGRLSEGNNCWGRNAPNDTPVALKGNGTFPSILLSPGVDGNRGEISSPTESKIQGKALDGVVLNSVSPFGTRNRIPQFWYPQLNEEVRLDTLVLNLPGLIKPLGPQHKLWFLAPEGTQVLDTKMTSFFLQLRDFTGSFVVDP